MIQARTQPLGFTADVNARRSDAASSFAELSSYTHIIMPIVVSFISQYVDSVEGGDASQASGKVW